MPPKTLKLTYFDARGRAESARWLLALAKFNYTDNRIKSENWPAYKPKTPFGQIPLLEIDGKEICQSWAIDYYLAREFGFLGSSIMESTEIIMIMGCYGDTFGAYTTAFYEKDETKKAALLKEFSETSLPKLLEFLNKHLNGKQYLVGNKISLADVIISSWLNDVPANLQAIISKYSDAAALIKRVASLPEIAAWMAKRPKTDI